jgi:hypothetical protein
MDEFLRTSLSSGLMTVIERKSYKALSYGNPYSMFAIELI